MRRWTTQWPRLVILGLSAPLDCGLSRHRCILSVGSAVTAALFMIANTCGSVGDDAGRGRLLRLRDWVRETGHLTVVRGPVLRAMDLPDVDLQVRQRAFRGPGEVLTHVCGVAVERGQQDLLFFAATDESDGSAVVWRASVAGELLRTVRFVDGIATSVSDAEFDVAFRREVEYFLRKMRDGALDTRSLPFSPVPAAGPQATAPRAEYSGDRPKAWFQENSPNPAQPVGSPCCRGNVDVRLASSLPSWRTLANYCFAAVAAADAASAEERAAQSLVLCSSDYTNRPPPKSPIRRSYSGDRWASTAADLVTR